MSPMTLFESQILSTFETTHHLAADFNTLSFAEIQQRKLCMGGIACTNPPGASSNLRKPGGFGG